MQRRFICWFALITDFVTLDPEDFNQLNQRLPAGSKGNDILG